MSDSPTLLSLADRCEKLTGPCRETDCLIFEAGHRLLTPERRSTIDGEPTGEYFDLDGNQLPERAPRYTESLDATMTLKPEGYSFALGDLNEVNFPWACVTDPNGADYTCLEDAATPALALLSALLRAIAAAGSAP